jgi:transcription elongation factor Elf1
MIALLAETPRDQEEIDRLVEENRKQREEIERLKKEIEEYKKRHPSVVGVKNGKAYFIMEEHSQKEKSTKNPGAQLGHKGHFRRTPKVTERDTLKASEFNCPICSSPLVRKGIRKRVIEDIPEIHTMIVQYRIERMYCKKCGKTYEPQIPEALPNTRLSLRAMLIASYFRIAMRMSLENVSVTMKEVFGLKISEGEVQEILYQLSNALGDEYRSLLKSIRKAPSRNMDTTSYRIEGENCDLWTFVTKGEAIFLVAKSNSHEVALKVLGKHNGTDIHDRFSAFETLASKTHNDQKYCWAHIISDARELESFYGDEGSRIKKSLKSIYNKAKSFNGNGTSEDVDRLYHRLIFLLDTGYEHLRSRKFVEKFDISADKGHFSFQNLKELSDAKIDSYIPAAKKGTENNKRGIPTKEYHRSKFIYDRTSDTYTCPQRHVMHPYSFYHLKGKLSKMRYRKYCTDACSSGEVRNKCTAEKQGRRIQQ